MPHLILLGDSTLDNGRYVSGTDVGSRIQELLPAGWQVTRRAHDGSMTVDVARQLVELPLDASHLVLSVGGNNALASQHVLDASGCRRRRPRRAHRVSWTAEQVLPAYEHLRQAVEAADWAVLHPDLKFTVGLGFGHYDETNDDGSGMVQLIDQRRYDAKSAGRNRVVGPGRSAALV